MFNIGMRYVIKRTDHVQKNFNLKYEHQSI